MNKGIEYKKKFIINFMYLAIVCGLYFVIVKYALGYIFPFLFAGALAMWLQRPINKLIKKFHLSSHGPISFVLVLLIIVIIVLVIVVVCTAIVGELKDFFTFLFGQFSSINEMLQALQKAAISVVNKLPGSIRSSASNYIIGFFTKLTSSESALNTSALAAPLSGAWSLIKSIPSALLAFLITIISCFFMTTDYVNIRNMFLGFFPEERRKKLIYTKRTIGKAIGKLIRAYLLIMFITFSEMFLGLYLFKILGFYTGGYIAIIAFVTCVIDIVPVLGTGTIVLPWALYNIFFGEVNLGIGLIVLYIVISVIREIIEPKLVAKQADLPAIVTIMAMFVGAKVLGVFGLLILPLTIIVLKLMYDEGIIGNKKKSEPVPETGEKAAVVKTVDQAGEKISAAFKRWKNDKK